MGPDSATRKLATGLAGILVEMVRGKVESGQGMGSGFKIRVQEKVRPGKFSVEVRSRCVARVLHLGLRFLLP